MYYYFLLGSLLAAVLPRKICYKLAEIIALFNYKFFKKDREKIDANLAVIISDAKERKKQVKNTFINFSYYLVDFFRYPKLNSRFLEKYVRVSGLENLDSTLAKHNGAIALTAHLGNYELAGAVTSLLGYPVSAVALPHKDKRVNKFFDQRRNMVGIKVISTGAAVRGCFLALKTGRVLALLGDRDFSGGGLEIKMFSRRARLPRGAAFFALKTKAPIIPAFFVRVNKYFYQLIFEKPLVVDQNDECSESELIQNYALVLEKYLRKYPGQWYMFHRYWFF